MSTRDKQYTVIGRYNDTGEVVIHYLNVGGEDIHYEVLRHWGQIQKMYPGYEVLVVFNGELSPCATPQTLSLYVKRHFADAAEGVG